MPTIGQAKLVKIRVPFKHSKRAWEFEGRRFILPTIGPLPSGCVCYDDKNSVENPRYLDLKTGQIYTT